MSKEANISACRPIFVCTISYTATSEIPGITVAGADPDLVKYTPAADAEFLQYGKCKCIPSVPATPDGKPTPAVITRAALTLSEMPFFIVDAGARVKPEVPHVSFGLEPGRNITKENAMSRDQVLRALSYGQAFGSQVARACDLLVLGESIPGGTTTALAVLSSLGIDARFKVSSSLAKNPHDKKNEVLKLAIERAGRLGDSAIDALSLFGDPMIPALAGMAQGATLINRRVLLAGGTQMAAIIAVLKSLGHPLTNVLVGSTPYVANDRTADLTGLISEVSPDVPILTCDIHLEESSKPGLRAFSQGFVKEGVGAGGTCVAALLKNGNLSGRDILRATEKEYELHIENSMQKSNEVRLR